MKNLCTKLSKLGLKFGGMAAAFVLMMGVTSTQSMCFMVFHQPKVPQGMSKFIKSM